MDGAQQKTIHKPAGLQSGTLIPGEPKNEAPAEEKSTFLTLWDLAQDSVFRTGESNFKGPGFSVLGASLAPPRLYID